MKTEFEKDFEMMIKALDRAYDAVSKMNDVYQMGIQSACIDVYLSDKNTRIICNYATREAIRMVQEVKGGESKFSTWPESDGTGGSCEDYAIPGADGYAITSYKTIASYEVEEGQR